MEIELPVTSSSKHAAVSQCGGCVTWQPTDQQFNLFAKHTMQDRVLVLFLFRGRHQFLMLSTKKLIFQKKIFFRLV